MELKMIWFMWSMINSDCIICTNLFRYITVKGPNREVSLIHQVTLENLWLSSNILFDVIMINFQSPCCVYLTWQIDAQIVFAVMELCCVLTVCFPFVLLWLLVFVCKSPWAVFISLHAQEVWKKIKKSHHHGKDVRNYLKYKNTSIRVDVVVLDQPPQSISPYQIIFNEKWTLENQLLSESLHWMFAFSVIHDIIPIFYKNAIIHYIYSIC